MNRSVLGVVTGVLAGLVLLYSLFIAGQFLLGIVFALQVVVAAFVLYLAVRFVRAVESIAESAECVADHTTDGSAVDRSTTNRPADD